MAFFPTTSFGDATPFLSADASPFVSAPAAVVEGAPIFAAPQVIQSPAQPNPYQLTPFTGVLPTDLGYGGYPAVGGYGAPSTFSGAGFGAPIGGGLGAGFSSLGLGAGTFTGVGGYGFNDVNAYASGVQSAGLLAPAVGPYPAATTVTGLAPTATSGVNPHNYAGFGFARPIAYGYERATLGGPYPNGVPAVNPVVPPYAAVGARTPVPPVGSYGVAKGRFHKGSKRVAGTGTAPGERYYYG